MVPIRTNTEMLNGVDAVMAAVNSRLRLLTGEWWENESLGFAVPDFLIRGVRTANGSELLSSYITAYIAATPGVQRVANVTSYTQNRRFFYHCTVVTDYGESEEEVSQDVILRAIS